MPPVFGPLSPSPTRLKSWAGSSGRATLPSHRANRDTSGPARNSSTSTGCPSPNTLLAWAAATARSSVTTTPLPAASPSSLTTYGEPHASSAGSIPSRSLTATEAAVGTPADRITSLANALDPSIRAAAAVGPNAGIARPFSSSTAPLTSGTSGPMTTRSTSRASARSAIAAESPTSTGWVRANRDVPALPGATCSSVTEGTGCCGSVGPGLSEGGGSGCDMPILVPFDDHLATIRAQAESLAVDAAAAGPDAPVPTCPRWTTADLVRHQGSVHRWAVAHAEGLTGNRPELVAKEAARDAPAGFGARLRWLVDGAATLVDALAAAPRDLRALRFLSDAPPARAFWARRQAHETTIHRVDAAAARQGRPLKPDDFDLDPALAADGLDELLTGFLPRNSSRLR